MSRRNRYLILSWKRKDVNKVISAGELTNGSSDVKLNEINKTGSWCAG